MQYKHMNEIFNAAMGKPTLDLALRFAEVETYDMLRDIGVSIDSASAATDDMLKDVAEHYQKPSMADLAKRPYLRLEV